MIYNQLIMNGFSFLYEEMAAQYFGVVATEHMDGLVSRLEEAGGKTLWTKVREALQQFLDDIRAALNRLAGRDPATAAALRTEEASAAHVLELFDEAVKQTEEIRKARLAEQGERIREKAERAESGVRSAESKTRSYKSTKGATAEELGRLADAQKRIAAGESEEQVRRETGWFQGYDGKWRLEIDDSKMELLAFNPDVPPSLDQLIVHDELFQAYPFLRDTTVFFLPLKNANGRYNKGENSIDLNRSLVEDAKKLKEALIHEIQHAIQEEEGLSPGANPAYWQRRINNKANNRSVGERKMMEEAAADIINLNKKMPNSFGSEMWAWFEERPTEPRGKITNWDTLEAEPDSPAWQQWDRRGEELSEKYGEDAVAEWLTLRERYENLSKNNGSTNANSLYYHTAGEIEARDVANRVDMTAEERRNTRPDIDRTDVVFADGGVSYSIKTSKEGDVYVEVDPQSIDMNNGLTVARNIADIIREKFHNLIKINGQNIVINANTNKEWRMSASARYLYKNEPQKYNDKLQAIYNADEILAAAKNWIGEEKSHKSQSKYAEFARGNVYFKVGNHGYIADVIVGIKANGTAVLHDLMHIYDKKITEGTVSMADKKNPQSTSISSVKSTIPQPAAGSQDASGKIANDSEYSEYEGENKTFSRRTEDVKEKFDEAVAGRD